MSVISAAPTGATDSVRTLASAKINARVATRQRFCVRFISKVAIAIPPISLALLRVVSFVGLRCQPLDPERCFGRSVFRRRAVPATRDGAVAGEAVDAELGQHDRIEGGAEQKRCLRVP